MEYDGPQSGLPLVLAEWQRAHPVGAALRLRLPDSWERARVELVVSGAGCSFDGVRRRAGALLVRGTRLRTLPDTVGPKLRVLLVGLNPSVYSADAGVGFARPGNRFWPAALASGLVTGDRDTFDALRTHRVGMTDLVKRATARADDLSAEEYRAGARRVEALVGWLRPGAVCFVGLSGYRLVADRTAVAGWQSPTFGTRPAYVMPNPSGLNAHATPAILAEHLRVVGLGQH